MHIFQWPVQLGTPSEIYLKKIKVLPLSADIMNISLNLSPLQIQVSNENTYISMACAILHTK